MDQKRRDRIQLGCLYEMFRDTLDEDVVYMVYTENEGRIEQTIEQLMPISASSFTGHYFEPQTDKLKESNSNSIHNPLSNDSNHNSNKAPIRDIDGTAAKRMTDNSSPSKEKVSQDDEQSLDEDDEELNLTIDERIERIRKSIDDLLDEKNLSHEKATKYLSRKMFSVTSYYSELASSMRRMIENKTNKLVDLLLEKSKDADHIDLHGLNPIQARLVVSELIKIRQNKLLIDKQGQVSVDIITGWGKHSPDQGQRIKPTIVALLREQGLEFHRVNRGALRVTIRRFPIRR